VVSEHGVVGLPVCVVVRRDECLADDVEVGLGRFAVDTAQDDGRLHVGRLDDILLLVGTEGLGVTGRDDTGEDSESCDGELHDRKNGTGGWSLIALLIASVLLLSEFGIVRRRSGGPKWMESGSKMKVEGVLPHDITVVWVR